MWNIVCEVPHDYRLGHDDVHVWLVRLDWINSRRKTIAQYLSPDEQQRAMKFCSQADADRHVVGRALAKLLVGRLLGIDPQFVLFGCSEFGKPQVTETQNNGQVKFNISHAGNFVLGALAIKREVGVDVERINNAVDIEGIATRFLSVREQSMLADLPPDKMVHGFFHGWTRKEAFIKARGEGLSLPLHQFDVVLRSGEPAMLSVTRPDAAEAGRWTIRDLDVGAGYAAAVAAEGSEWQLKLMDWRT